MLSRYLEPLLPVEPVRTSSPAPVGNNGDFDGFTLAVHDPECGGLVVYLPNTARYALVTVEPTKPELGKDAIFCRRHARARFRTNNHLFSVAAIFDALPSGNYRVSSSSFESLANIAKGNIVVIDWR